MVQEIHVTWICPEVKGDLSCEHMTTDMAGECLHCGHIDEHRSEVIVDKLDDTVNQWKGRVIFLTSMIEEAEEECSYCGGKKGTEEEVMFACDPQDKEAVSILENLW